MIGIDDDGAILDPRGGTGSGGGVSNPGGPVYQDTTGGGDGGPLLVFKQRQRPKINPHIQVKGLGPTPTVRSPALDVNDKKIGDPRLLALPTDWGLDYHPASRSPKDNLDPRGTSPTSTESSFSLVLVAGALFVVWYLVKGGK